MHEQCMDNHKFNKLFIISNNVRTKAKMYSRSVLALHYGNVYLSKVSQVVV